MKIKVTFREILDSGYWSEFCRQHGFNEWMVNEGLAKSSETTEISIEEAKRYGLIKVNQ